MELFLLAVTVLALGCLAYLPVRRAIDLGLRYSPTERQFIRAREAALEREPGQLGAALELVALYRRRGDHASARALYRATRERFSGKPEYRPVEQAAAAGPWLTVAAGTPVEPGRPQSLDLDGATATGRLHLEGLTLQGLIDVARLEVEIAGLGSERSAAVPPELRVVALEAAIAEDRFNRYLAGTAGDLPPGLTNLRVEVSAGELALLGSFVRIPFRMALQVRLASDHALLFHFPRAAQFLGIPAIPASALADKIVKAIQDRYARLVTVIDPTTFVVDLGAAAPLPVRLNLTSVVLSNGELVLRADANAPAALDLGPWAGSPRVPAPAPAVASHVLEASTLPVPLPAVQGNGGTSPAEYRAAVARGELGLALAVGERVLATRVHDSVLREEVVALAMRSGEAKRAVDIALAPVPPAPDGAPHPTPRLRLMASQALAGLGRKEEAEILLEGLETALVGPPGDSGLAQDLVTLATLRVRLLGDLARGALALERVLEAVGSPRAAGTIAASSTADPLRPAVQLAWEAGRAELCERLADRLVAAAPFESTGWRLLGLALRRREQAFRAYTALSAASWLNPQDRTVQQDVAELHRDVEHVLAEARHVVPPASLVHPSESAGVGAVLRAIVPHLMPVLGADGSVEEAEFGIPAPLAASATVVTEASHPELVGAVRAACAALEVRLPRVLLVPDSVPDVAAVIARVPVIKVTTGAIVDLGRDELAYAFGRAVWQAERGDARFRALSRGQQQALAEVLDLLRRPPEWGARLAGVADLPGLNALADSAIGRWAGRFHEETWPHEAALERLLPPPVGAAARHEARARLERRPNTADVAAWCASLDLSADRAGLHVCRDLRAALGGMLKLEVRSRALVAQVRERGLAWGVQTFGTTGTAVRVAEIMIYAVRELHAPAERLLL